MPSLPVFARAVELGSKMVARRSRSVPLARVKHVYETMVADHAARGYSEDRPERARLRDNQSKSEIELAGIYPELAADGAHSKSSRDGINRKKLDMETLVWTSGRDFPLSRLESRCPRCESRNVVVLYEPPANAAVRRK